MSGAGARQPSSSGPGRPQPMTSLGGPSWAHLLYVLDVYRYVMLCLVLGTTSVLLGLSLLSIFLVLRLQTSSDHLLQTIPLFVPALILLSTGLSLLAFISKKARRFGLLKLVCSVYLVLSFLLIVMIVTTGVVHLPRLNNYRECVYTKRLRACTCVQHPKTKAVVIGAHHFTMEDIDNCEVVHTLLYDCLRVVFGLSFVALLVSIFAIMTLYQLLLHEHQKLFFIRISTSFRGNRKAATTPNSNTTPTSSEVSRIRLSADYSEQDLLVAGGGGGGNVFTAGDSNPATTDVGIWLSSQSGQHTPPPSRGLSTDIPLASSSSSSSSALRHYLRLLKTQSTRWQAFVFAKLDSLRPQSAAAGVEHAHHPDYHQHHHQHHHQPRHGSVPCVCAFHQHLYENSHSHDHIMSHSICLRDYVNNAKAAHCNNNNNDNDNSNNSPGAEASLVPPHVLQSVYAQYEQSQYEHEPTSSSLLARRVPTPMHTTGNKTVLSTPSSTSTSSCAEDDDEDDDDDDDDDDDQDEEEEEVEGAEEDSTQTSASVLNQTKTSSAQVNSNYIADVNDNSQYFLDDSNLVRTSFKQPDNIGDGYGAENDGAPETVLTMQASEDNIAPSWSHANLFACVDEDEASVEVIRIPITVQPPNVPAMLPTTTATTSSTTMAPFYAAYYAPNEPQTVADDNANDYKKAFEEAFKNYYDSQNRISQRSLVQQQQQDYHGSRSNAKGMTSKSLETIESRRNDNNYLYQQQQQPQQIVVQNVIAKPQQQQQHQQEFMMSDDEFPAIEPPADYKNIAVCVEAVDHDGQDSGGSRQHQAQQHSLETLTTTPNLMQSYHFWVQQFIDQISQQQHQVGLNNERHASIDDFDSLEHGLVEDDEDCDEDDDDDEDDDGAGDTSTSQDIADFELELDEEPIKYVQDEDTFNEKDNSILQPLPIDPTPPPGAEVTPKLEARVNKDDNNNVDKLLRQQAKLQRACCLEGDDSSSECLTNHNNNESDDNTDQGSESLTAEFIKPPTPFTNYYYHLHNPK